MDDCPEYDVFAVSSKRRGQTWRFWYVCTRVLKDVLDFYPARNFNQ